MRMERGRGLYARKWASGRGGHQVAAEHGENADVAGFNLWGRVTPEIRSAFSTRFFSMRLAIKFRGTSPSRGFV